MFLHTLAAVAAGQAEKFFPWPATFAIIIYLFSLGVLNESVRLSNAQETRLMMRLMRYAPFVTALVLTGVIAFFWMRMLQRNHVMTLGEDAFGDLYQFFLDNPKSLVSPTLAATVLPMAYSSYRLAIIFMHYRTSADTMIERPIASRAMLGIICNEINLFVAVAVIYSSHVSKWLHLQ